MTGLVASAILCGIGVAVGILLIVGAFLGVPVPELGRVSRAGAWLRGTGGVQLVVATIAALVVLKFTGWVAVAAAVFALVVGWRQFFGAARAEQAAVARIEALASWTESLRDAISNGAAMAETLPASVAAAPDALLPALTVMVETMQARRPISEALLNMADVLDDASADLIISALADNVQGKNLRGVLSILSRSARSEVEVRRKVDAERRSVRRSMRIALIIIALVAGGMAIFNPAYVQPYQYAQGQLVLGLVVALFVIGGVWMRRLARFTKPERFLTPQGAAGLRGTPTSTPVHFGGAA